MCEPWFYVGETGLVKDSNFKGLSALVSGLGGMPENLRDVAVLRSRVESVLTGYCRWMIRSIGRNG